MNEFHVITFLLGQRGDDIGADDDELKKYLGFSGDDGTARLYSLLNAYTKEVSILGLKIERNPLDGKWFLTYSDNIRDLAKVNPFHGRSRLASTLVAILIAIAFEGETTTIERVRKLRNVKDVKPDLKDLEELGLVKIIGEYVNITPKIGYYIDVLEFITNFNDFLEKKYCNNQEKDE